MSKQHLPLEIVAAWCRDAAQVLEPGLTEKLASMRRDIISECANSVKIHEVAADLAEGLEAQPEEIRLTAEKLLISRYGFSYQFFRDAKLRSVRAVLKRGKIRTETEHRALLEFLSGVDSGSAMERAAAELLLAHAMGE